MDLYETLSRFYDLENADFVEDLDFWVRLAKEANGPVLELGCGTGRVTQQIARAGVNVVGLDNSESMLALARAKLNHRPELAAHAKLVSGDMTKFDLTLAPQRSPAEERPGDTETPSPGARPDTLTNVQRFSLILVPFNTFMHLLTTAEQLALLNSARQHLTPGGRLVLDLTHAPPAYADPPTETFTLERTFTDDIYHLTIQQFSTIRLDRTAQLAHIVYHYDAVTAEGSVKRTLVPLTLRYTFPAEMGLLLDRTGFRLAHLYGDYADAPLTDDSERMVVVAETA